ncbi:LacI family DNA-binding transcriptional regulator [Leptothrix discophora]|uniref:LacI family DNA-binding transcriptional regulator n=1 Tax=Leptothrix discophora TaxID=89 RepID=A0ABT9FYN7_LEPDI|nr:LacI family DNA-binding transcriptional regulator [Leptothrix discophora]MDP4299333.1 LacI family DNA-binding transcriptional regulator [Leptothrix discophora]
MARPFLVKDIALQAGVSTATVDRVLHGRENVREHMVRRVEQAMAALERQRGQVGLVGRKFMIDLVMETPARFATEVRDALDAEMAALRPVLFRARHETREVWSPDGIVETLARIAQRGSHGVLLKAPDVPAVNAAVAQLTGLGIPVVTVATDLPASRRLAYVGLDHAVAGQTAAWLIGQWLGPVRRAAVLVSLSSVRFRGEETRESAFRLALQREHPRLRTVDVSEGHGLHERTARLVRQRLRAHEDLVAVYSAGGANAAILEAFELEGRRCRCFIGHDLDADNVRLLRERRLHAVLHHDLRHDMRRACLALLAAHGVSGLEPPPGLSPVHVATPFNLPG